VIVTAVLVAVSCGGGDDPAPTAGEPTTGEPATATSTAASAGAEFAITRVQFGSDGFVEITNVGDVAGSFEGWSLCQRPSYIDVSSGGELAPGESVQVPASAGYGGLDAGDGEIGLYTSSSFGSADAIVSYVEWGDGGHGRSSVAVEAGIWDGVGVKTGGADAIVAPRGAATAGGWNAEG
jgi:hypothetical protein